MKKFISIFLLNLKMHQQIAWEYRFSYFFRIFRILLDFGISLLTINIFFVNTESIGGWSKAEAFLIYSLFQIVNSFYNLLCGDSMDEMDSDVRFGRLDIYLLRPIDSQFLVSTKRVFPSVVYRIILSGSLLVYALSQLQVSMTPTQIILTLTTLISSLVIYYSFIFVSAVTSFWTFGGEATDLMSAIVSTSRYPLDIFSKKITQILTIIPLIFLVTIPAKVILGIEDPLIYISPLVALITIFLSRKFWFFALRHYSSASS